MAARVACSCPSPSTHYSSWQMLNFAKQIGATHAHTYFYASSCTADSPTHLKQHAVALDGLANKFNMFPPCLHKSMSAAAHAPKTFTAGPQGNDLRPALTKLRPPLVVAPH